MCVCGGGGGARPRVYVLSLLVFPVAAAAAAFCIAARYVYGLHATADAQIMKKCMYSKRQGKYDSLPPSRHQLIKQLYCLCDLQWPFSLSHIRSTVALFHPSPPRETDRLMPLS